MVLTGRKYGAQGGLEIAESRLRHRALMGMVATEQAGLAAILQPIIKPMARTDAI